MIWAISIWLGIVLGGWLGFDEHKCTWKNVWWQLPTNIFLELDESLCDLFNYDPALGKTGLLERDTLSTYAYRKDSKWQYVINLVMLDPNHCRRYWLKRYLPDTPR